jgi:hypothetical protein
LTAGNRFHRLEYLVYFFRGVEQAETETDRPSRAGPQILVNKGCAVESCTGGDPEIPVKDGAYLLRVYALNIAQK